MSDDIFIFDESGTILKGVKDTTIKSVIIPNGVKSIGEKAFYECSGLKSGVIPSNVTNIGDHTFYKCTGLKTLSGIDNWHFNHEFKYENTFDQCPNIKADEFNNKLKAKIDQIKNNNNNKIEN